MDFGGYSFFTTFVIFNANFSALKQKSEVYNFLSSKLAPKVKTDSPCMDGYEASNLTNPNMLLKARGFLAYAHVKPPVDVDIELICPVDVHYIVLHTVVGSQRSTGIVLLGADHMNRFVEFAQSTFQADGVIFCNSNYYTKSKLPPNMNNFPIRFFKSNYRYVFSKCNKFKVRIFRTDRTVPCLANVEIWGTVSSKCPQVTVNTIHHLMNKSVKPTVPKLEDITLPKDFQVPDEYLDALTYELMTLPMTLPSGHNVDQTTLEKCINGEGAYGRLPSDPFTGLKFTEFRKPVFNVALKTRIDMFLVKNANTKELFDVKRTLGKKHALNSSKTSSCVTNKKFKYYSQQCKGEETVQSVNYESASLDDAVNKALNSENFLRFTLDKKDNALEKKCCVLCKIDENIYILPCEHLYCRICLLKICKVSKCSECDKQFAKAEVRRFHI